MKTQEQSSTLKEEVPKIKEGLLDKYEKEPVKEVTKETTKLPKPTGWRMLILPFSGMGMSKGGIIMTKDTVDRERLSTVCAYVVKMGPLCYQDAKFGNKAWCKEKQWVLIGRYAGARFKLGDDAECRIINDDEVIATIHDPTDIVAV